jgi:tetratricopeptide (TPR) repeat protein
MAQPRCDAGASEALERAAQAANQAGRHEEALGMFEQAYTACHGARALARAALTEASLGRWLDADAHLREAMARSDDPWITRSRAALEIESRRIGEHVGSLVVTGEGAAGEVRVDGRRVADWPMRDPVRVLAGSVTVTVHAEGFRDVDRSLRVEPGVLHREEVTLTPSPVVVTREAPAPVTIAAQPPATSSVPTIVVVPVMRVEDRTSRERGPSVARVAAWTSLGLAVVGLSVGVTAWALRESALADLDAAGCGPTPPDRARCDTLADQADGTRPWIIGGFVAGGAFAVATTLLFAFDNGRRDAGSSSAWRCGQGPGTVGLACGVAF